MSRGEDKKGEPFGVKFLNFNHIGKTAAGMWADSRREMLNYIILISKIFLEIFL